MASWQDIVALPPVQTAAPGAYPVSLTDMQKHSRIDADDDDASLGAYIAAATRHVENLAGQRLITQTWTQSFSGLADRLYLDVAPVSAITGITYYDADNASQTLTSSLYRLQKAREGVYVEQDSGSTYPDTYVRADAVTVTMTAGYGAAGSATPQELRQAIMLIAAQWYEMREDAMPMESRPIPNGALALIAPQRRGWL